MGQEVLVAYNVGGTNSRVAFAGFEKGRAVRLPELAEPISQPRRGTDEFLAFVQETLGMLPGGAVIAGAACAFAGPVTHGDEVCMTNWPEPRCVTRDQLVEVGLPAATRVVNDMVAGAEGVLDRIDHGGAGVTRLFDPGDRDLDSGNIVFLAPGTGLGAATLARTGLADPAHVPVGCECQHTAIPAFADDVSGWLDPLGEILGRVPTWEDVVSGRGLAYVHAALVAADSGSLPEAPDDSGTPAIAEAALAGDTLAERALTVYYRALGRFAQLLALGAQPCVGVFLGGATTSKNIDFVLRGDLVREFLDNDLMAETLAEVPVQVVEGELNLDGGLRIAAQAARARPPKAQFRSFGG
jgi:glucokinase